MRRLLEHGGGDPEFLKLWTGGFVSSLGFHISTLAMQLTAVVVLGAGPIEVGILGACQFLPRFAFGLVAGVWVDRVRRRPLLIVADLGRAALLASIPVAHLGGWLSIEQLYLVALGMATFSTFFEVSIFSYLPGLVGRDRLIDANSRLRAGEAVSQIGGPNLAGALVQWLSAPIAIGVDAVSYLVSAGLIGWIRRPEPAVAPPGSRRDMVAEVREGLRVVGRHPVLRSLLASGVTISFFTGGIRGSLIVLYLVNIGITPIEFGVIYGVGGASALVGAFLARHVPGAIGLGRTLVVGQLLTAVFAAFVPLAGLAPSVALGVLLVGQVGLGIVGPIWGVNAGTLQQAVTPDPYLGRVGATNHVALSGANPLGALFGGVLASVVGLPVTLTVAAAGAALSALWLLRSPVRDLDRMPQPLGVQP